MEVELTDLEIHQCMTGSQIHRRMDCMTLVCCLGYWRQHQIRGLWEDFCFPNISTIPSCFYYFFPGREVDRSGLMAEMQKPYCNFEVICIKVGMHML